MKHFRLSISRDFAPRCAVILFFALSVLFLAGCSPHKLKIISAAYGSGTSYADVSARVSDMVRETSGFNANPEWLKVDPTPGWNKTLVIVYEVGGRRHVFAASEGGRVSAAILQDAAGHPPAAS